LQDFVKKKTVEKKSTFSLIFENFKL